MENLILIQGSELNVAIAAVNILSAFQKLKKETEKPELLLSQETYFLMICEIGDALPCANHESLRSVVLFPPSSACPPYPSDGR